MRSIVMGDAFAERSAADPMLSSSEDFEAGLPETPGEPRHARVKLAAVVAAAAAAGAFGTLALTTGLRFSAAQSGHVDGNMLLTSEPTPVASYGLDEASDYGGDSASYYGSASLDGFGTISQTVLEDPDFLTDSEAAAPAPPPPPAAPKMCMTYAGVKLAEVAPAPAWPQCVAKWSVDCSKVGCCSDAGMQCFKKSDGWAACKASCDKMDDRNETWTCDVVSTAVPHTDASCQAACKADAECQQAIFNGDDRSCSLSNQRQTQVVWAGDNYNSTFCGTFDEKDKMIDLIGQVRSALPFHQPALPIVNCSWGGEDCSQTKCCNDVKCDPNFENCWGYSCYKKSEYFAGCRNEPPPADWIGTWLGGPREHRTIWPAGSQVALHGTTLYCFMVVSWNAPRPKPFWSTEAELANNIKQHGVGIFQCDGHDIFDGIETPKAEWGSFSNIDAFQMVWQKINEKGDWKKYDWTVKVDADAVFFPQRLKQHLDKLRTPSGARVYLENTWYRFKFMGALEIVSREALEVFVEQSHTCIRGEHAGGEDFFMKGCMDALGVDHQTDDSLLHDKYAAQDGPCTDGWTVAYHFHKKVISWNWCYNEAVCGNRGKTCQWGLDVEFVMPWAPSAAAAPGR